ncbi:ABC transporter permease [Ruminiclostridium cellobioparum]|uniref:ABC-type polysaccharide transport system, permease component n=1 Tax=Ruminiclostridium cellobioparum subsp. termitidis CT1112 TaxID=1195236 RepID=S0FN39_RUMCE|nr:ABC-type polysaccharide transport system, permease component [Ruminiclostridium cellobioparum subsp. termitidis CT1112]
MNKRMSSLKLQTHYSIMVIPGVLWMILFNIVPMTGVVMAFKNYNPGLGLWKSPGVGLENFKYLFSMSDAQRVIINTLIIACSKVVLNIVIPLAFALLLNEVTNMRYKKFVQTAVYLPHFLSWVILASVILNIFSLDGIVNQITGIFGGKPVIWFSMASYFRQLVIGTDVWKEFGFNAVIFLAALTGINPNLYEAATIDGCSKWKSIWYITIPGITGTIVLLGVLGLGNVLNAGFDQIYNLYNPMVYSTGDILDTWVYRIGLVNLQFSLATTAGLFKSAISFIMIVVSYWAAYKLADYKIF